jgi:hypothetical protein
MADAQRVNLEKILEVVKISGDDLKKVSVITLILSNMVPILGVIFFGWHAFALLFLFWFENIVIGVSNIFKMAIVSPNNNEKAAAKVSAIAFFIVHYGIFTLVHGLFIFVIFGEFLSETEGSGIFNVFGNFADLHLGWAILALIISHTVSFFLNYIGKREYKSSSLNQLMIQPYTRVVILHITIIFGGFLVAFFGSPVVGLILLIALKTYIDIKTHLKQHTIFDTDPGNKVETVGT